MWLITFTIFYHSDLLGRFHISFSILSHFQFMAFLMPHVGQPDVGHGGVDDDGESAFDAQIVNSS